MYQLSSNVFQLSSNVFQLSSNVFQLSSNVYVFTCSSPWITSTRDIESHTSQKQKISLKMYKLVYIVSYNDKPSFLTYIFKSWLPLTSLPHELTGPDINSMGVF